jgi:transcriptional regulator NrdR family protein
MTCPKCGCGDLPVAYIRHRSGDAKRVRECRHCGQRLRTTETIVGLVT